MGMKLSTPQLYALRTFVPRLKSWLDRHNRQQLAKRISALTGFSPSAVYLVLIGAGDDLFVTRWALEHAMTTNLHPRPNEVDRASYRRWVPTLAWERVRLEAQARAAVQAIVGRVVK